jgi:hypothetical protein
MSLFPKEPKKIKERISRYERELRKEYENFGNIGDSYGKRYLLGPLYLLLGDVAGALKSFEWYDKTFPDDSGEPFHFLSWTLVLYRSGNMPSAEEKLRQTMFSNLYLIPNLLGLKHERLDIWHGSNIEEPEYLYDFPLELIAIWEEAELKWARKTYEKQEFQQARSRYIEIFHQLINEPIGPKRSKLVEEAYNLKALSLYQ